MLSSTALAFRGEEWEWEARQLHLQYSVSSRKNMDAHAKLEEDKCSIMIITSLIIHSKCNHLVLVIHTGP